MAENQHTPGQGWRRLMRRPSSASLVSIGAHAILGVLIWNALQMPAVFDRFLQFDREAKPVAERVEYVTIAPPAPAAPAPPSRSRTSTTAAPQSEAPAVVPLVAPREIPTQLPAPAATTDTTLPRAVVGPLRGGNGPTRGVQPNYDDPRVWNSDTEFIYAPKTEQQRLDSALYATLARHMDSVAANTSVPNKFERGDWTVGKGGSKFGVDQQYIHLGPFKIPSALLALLPLNQMQANPIAMDRARNANYMRNDIMYHAQAAMNEEQFRKAVAAIRARKDRERARGVAPNTPGPMSSPGERPPPN
jgi:hypothetical protein